MKRVTKAEAFKAMKNILYAMRDDTDVDCFFTVVRFIEQQWEPEEHAEAVKSEGTI